jgi:microcin C transport system permease protein
VVARRVGELGQSGLELGISCVLLGVHGARLILHRGLCTGGRSNPTHLVAGPPAVSVAATASDCWSFLGYFRRDSFVLRFVGTTTYFIRRLLLIIPTFIGITVLVFAVTRVVPGGPIERMLADALMSGGDGRSAAATMLSDAQLDQLRVYYGLDKPILIGYATWLGKVVQLDLGRSTRYNEPVWQTIKRRFPVLLFFGVTALVLTYAICIPLGIWKAIHHRSVFDNVTSGLVFLGFAIPGYVVAIALLTFLASRLGWFPLGGFVSDTFSQLSAWEQILDVLHHGTLPLLSYMAGSFAVTTFVMKNSLMDNLSAEYVRTAIAKGLSFRRAVFGHAVRNSLIPVATSFGNNLTVILGGSFLIERIYNIDGFGLLGYESLVARDYPVVLGILVVSSLLFLVGNIVSDICVAIVDPRVKFGT